MPGDVACFPVRMKLQFVSTSYLPINKNYSLLELAPSTFTVTIEVLTKRDVSVLHCARIRIPLPPPPFWSYTTN